MPWSAKLFVETPVPEGGELAVPARPGLGLAFDEDVLRRYGAGG
jgi:L-alanine-DL-glutamate epimerase-like enolase superfamily enzyme